MFPRDMSPSNISIPPKTSLSGFLLLIYLNETLSASPNFAPGFLPMLTTTMSSAPASIAILTGMLSEYPPSTKADSPILYDFMNGNAAALAST